MEHKSQEKQKSQAKPNEQSNTSKKVKQNTTGVKVAQNKTGSQKNATLSCIGVAEVDQPQSADIYCQTHPKVEKYIANPSIP